ncbi:MAG: 2,3,4,5-tetrahydropyridine-2,6-dicarboxylate N-succinyltransferase, partial [Sphingomonadaceae bacterium]|nr:2,3,4,5-tetrahydropyridine-2,6-dicarboxylate N-succinyltransferase [Sphingomonadaceae bacterium]
MTDALETTIEALWEDRDSLSPATSGAARDAVNAALELLD